ncbi:MAG: hypothetical protein QOH67_492, partial [Hyphomicrobiales bacterium]|nr:hypothetical protein [Hyphomicrobiales bacterium]
MGQPFSTIRPALEKLLEAEYFLGGMLTRHGIELQFKLNALLSAARSVTYALQKYQSNVPTFEGWYGPRRAIMKNDTAMRFFIELRNISQKEGPVSYFGGGGT